jgi:phage-related minor tail protein
MADDIKIKLGLDATELFNGLNKVTTELNQVQNESKQTDQALDKMADINTSGAVADVNKLSAAIDGVGDSASGLGGVFEGLKGGLGDALSGGLIGGLVGGGLAAGVQAGVGAIIDGFGAVVDAGRGLISAQGDLQAQTGATGAEFEALKNAADEAFLGGVGESVAEATKVISNAKVVLKDALPTDQIGEFVKGAQALGSLYDKDVNEVIAKSTPFIKQFGLDGKEAFDLIAFAAKEGKTSQDDVLDTLAEYSQLLSEAGFSAEDFAGQMAIAGQEGLFNTDKIADSIKEAQIRLKAGDTAKAFTDIKNQLPQALGSTLGNLEQLASSGQITIKEFLQKSGESIKTAFDAGQISEAMATQLQVAVAGTPAEDIGVEAYNKMFGAPIPTEEIKKKAAQAGQDAMNAAGQYLSFDMVSRNLELAFTKASAVVVKGASDAFGMIATAVGPAFSELGATLSGVFERIWTVIGPIVMGIGAAIMTNIVGAFNIAITVVTTVLDIFTSIFDSIASSLRPLIDVFSQAFGEDGAVGQGKTVVQSFQEALNFVGEVIREVGGIVADIGGLIIEFLITPFQTLIEVIADVTRSIAGWISTNDSSTESMKESGKAAQNSKGFIDTLRQAFDNIRGTIGGVRESFIQIKTTIGEFWDAITQLDIQKALSAFTGFGDKLSDAYDKGFNATKEQIQKTNQVVKKGNEDAANEAAKAAAAKAAAEKAAKEKADAAEKERLRKLALANAKGKGADAESELQQLKRFYKGRQDELENDIEREVNSEKNRGKDLKAIRAQLDAEANIKLKQWLNERIGGITDANAFLDKNQLTAKITPSKKKGETVADIDNFYTQEMAKLADKLTVEVGISAKPPEFKELEKEFDTLAKDIAKTSESLVPKTLATSQEALDGTIATVQQYIDFIKLQNDEIALKQAEAIAAGNQEAADKFGESIQTNIQNINLLSGRLERFGTESKTAIEKAARESTLEFQIQTALQTSILDAFNSEKIRKEKEANDAIREERLGALNAEEDDLTKSLAKREISFEDYAAKIADIDAQRKQVEEQTEVTFLQRLKTAGDQAAASVLKSQSEIFKKNAQGMEGNQKIFNEFVGQTLEQFGTLAASGKATLADFGNAAAGAAFDAVSKMIPSFVVGILGSSITTLGPIAGPIIAATLTAGLQLLLASARGALGFKDGVVGLEGPGDERSDSIPAWLSKGESVITAAGTRANREELEWMNNNPGMSIRDYFTSNAPQIRYSVQEDGNLIQEVRKLREETRGLGKQINRNTHVEISGALVADNNSIKAVIERDRRRNARRG